LNNQGFLFEPTFLVLYNKKHIKKGGSDEKELFNAQHLCKQIVFCRRYFDKQR
jgi:hypothetical protein